MFLIFRCFF